MTTLDDLKTFIEAAEAEARNQDETVAQFFHYLEGLSPDAVLQFRAEALPELASRQLPACPEPAAKPGALFIRA